MESVQDMANFNERLERTSSAYGCYQASKEAISIANRADFTENFTIHHDIFPNCTRNERFWSSITGIANIGYASALYLELRFVVTLTKMRRA